MSYRDDRRRRDEDRDHSRSRSDHHIDTDQVTGAVLTPDRRPAPKEDLSSVLVEKQETSSKLETPTKQPDKKQPSKNIETVSITLSQFDGDEEQFMSALGFPTSFGTTKGKKVEGNITGYMQRQHRKFKAHDYDRFAMEKKLQGKN
ncbi:hypothetical protein BLNAU_5699 [Blattamonas nauphoetae]|uniref:U4/U6.U5 small nuclear ribonucleoprotein 27kDa protein domain-containing protein n=1 Tax=Blattamonas nauphoetae TaxID=2049346 RepID=A0ABQ9Y6S5_9EUKA|nr:hypothetical protein BLNAU_5699 [Blattamonas nauphoetae]